MIESKYLWIALAVFLYNPNLKRYSCLTQFLIAVLHDSSLAKQFYTTASDQAAKLAKMNE